jgi:hypothetical protein
MIPPISNIEWSELVTGNKKVNLSSHTLKITINNLRKKIRNGQLSVEMAAHELYLDCKTNYDIYKYDLYLIFPKEIIQ